MTLHVLLALLGVNSAHAYGSSVDIELVRPWFATGALPGFDSPVIEGRGHAQYGGLTQYQRDPLIVYEDGTEVGTAVAYRQSIGFGASWDLGRAVAARVVVPGALQWGSSRDELSRDGPVLGDISAGMRFRFVDTDRVQWGTSLDLFLPTATREAWMGETLPRGRIGAPGLVRLGRVDLLLDPSILIRQEVITPVDFNLGPELSTAAGVRYHVWRDRVAIAGSYIARNGFEYFFQSGAENPSELLATVQVQPRPDLQWDIGLGKGLAEGYGTTELRAFAGLTWKRRPPPPEPVARIVIAEVPKEALPPVYEEPEPEPEWEEEELAQVRGEKIVIREPIQFEFNTANILPVSLPTLQYVASLLNDNWQIAHLVIEGHASDEGSFVYNYDLSIRRSRAIWEELIRAGVHPDRMSYRGMGEVVPIVQGEDEATLATNRRVEFRIVRQYGPNEQPPAYREGVLLPWSGDAATIRNPEPPPPPEPKAAEKKDDDADLGSFFDDLEEELEAPATEPTSPAPEGSAPAEESGP